MSQKTLLFKLFILLLAVELIPKTNLLASGICSSSSDGGDVIIVRCQEGQLTGAPRIPSSTRIEAYYDADLASVCAYLINAGETVDVEFNNLSTGDSFTFEIPGAGMSVMPIGGAAGYWTVTFTLSSGAVYEGEFVI